MQFVGKFPVRTELEVLPPREGPSEAEKELQVHGSIALRLAAAYDDLRPNTIDEATRLVRGAEVLVRAKDGGFYFLPLEKDSLGWYVVVLERRLDVVVDPERKLWVVRNTV